MQKESQVEEYERELARARWRLRKLREEVKQTKRKVEEAGERNTPLQDSIRQSYEEILQVQEDAHVYICVCLCVSVIATVGLNNIVSVNTVINA